ncbi:hypothetical protein [uncultured Cohaesibacter sp.]|uniref:hypothetical protein n=1 Tax=uncultured Cohaesibacter sp. TaxID=1002546 RepID=UPI0029C6297E|nr:hypothetical protein [uncultured Cohaesibacter sp.]
MKIGLRVYIYSLLVMVTALGLLGLMSVVKYESILTDTVVKRQHAITNDIRNSIEKAGVLGVPIRSFSQFEGAMAATAASVEKDVHLVVINNSGKDLIYQNSPIKGADLAAFKSIVMGKEIQEFLKDKTDHWSVRRDNYLFSGSTIINPFGQVDGAVVTMQSDAGINARTSAMLTRIAYFSALVLLPSALLAALVIYTSLRPLEQSIRTIRHVVEEVPEAKPEIEGPLAPTLRWFSDVYSKFVSQRRTAISTLDSIEALARQNGQEGR